jgi:hypothetical protein
VAWRQARVWAKAHPRAIGYVVMSMGPQDGGWWFYLVAGGRASRVSWADVVAM